MDSATAADWRVLLAIANHQGYKNRRTFPLYVAKTAEEARCSRRQALKSISWWVKVGALIKTKRRRVNVYEIPQHFNVPPGISARVLHSTPRVLKRDDQGRIVHTHCTRRVHAHDTIEVHAHGTLNQKSCSDIFPENPLASPTGGNGHSSETFSGLNSPSIIISEKTIKELQKALGRKKLLAYMKEQGYPLSLLPPEEEKP
jgi:hypothetical protein